jgi:ADP-ribose 1''-phosphate phosphatase
MPQPRRWIACLFTSIGYGKPNIKLNNPGKDSPSKILTNTRLALEELRTQLEEFRLSNFNKMTRRKSDDYKPGEIWSVKFNSGAFGVDWLDSLRALRQEFDGFERPWFIVEKINSDACQATGEEVDEAAVEPMTRRTRKSREC